MGTTRRHAVRWLAVALVLAVLETAAVAGGAGGQGATTAPTITADPATNLRDQQSITVSGTVPGTDLGGFAEIAQCPTGVDEPGRCAGIFGFGLPQETFELPVQVLRFLQANGREYDCANGCDVRVTVFLDDRTTRFATAPISFDLDEPVQPRPVVMASPARGLVDSQEIVVTGRHFAPYASIDVFQCTGVDQYACESGGFVQAVAGPKGRLRASFPARRVVSTFATEGGGTATTDCAEERCFLFVVSGNNRRQAERIRLRFDRDVAVEPPVLEVRPRRGLADAQAVAVRSDSGFAGPIRQCVVRGGQPNLNRCVGLNTIAIEDGVEGSTATVLVQRILRLVDDRPEDDAASIRSGEPIERYYARRTRAVDCARRRGACAIVTGGFDQPVASAKISFDPALPIPEPAFAVTPADDLVDGQRVTATVTGVNGFTAIYQCPPGTEPTNRPCRYRGGFSGAVSDIDLSVERFLGGPARIDCAATAQPCSLWMVSVEDETVRLSLSLDFAPAEPVVDPTLTVEPNTALADRQPVTLTVSGGTAGSWRVDQCQGVAETRPVCQRLASYDVETSSDGKVTTAVVYPYRRLGNREPIDCAATTCVLRLLANGRFEADRVRLRFDPDAPDSPTATMRVRPSRGLNDGQRVRVRVVTTEPGQLNQCLADVGTCQFVDYLSPARPEEAVTTRVRVERTLRTEGGDLMDCAVAPGTCELVFAPNDQPATVVALSFDTDSPAQGPLRVRVRPRRNLVDRQTVTVQVRGDANLDYGYGLRQCLITDYGVAGATCRFSDTAPVEVDGGYDFRFSVRRVLAVRGARDADCALTDRCALLFTTFDPFTGDLEVTRTVYLNFDADVPPAPVTPSGMTVEPSTALADGQVVQVTATGFDDVAPPIFVLQCASDIYPSSADDLDTEDCDTGRIVPTTPDGAGVIEATFEVHAEGCGGTRVCYLVAGDASATVVAISPALEFAP